MEPVNITRIDAPFPEQWKEEMHQFITELGAIKESIDVLSVNYLKSAEARGKLAEYYEEGGSASVVASRPTTSTSSGPILNRYGQPFESTPPDINDATVRKVLAAAGAAGGYGGTPPPGGFGGGGSGGPPSPGGSSGSGGPTTPSNSESYAQRYLKENGPMEMPQYYGGQYTAQDLLKGGAQLFQHAQDNWASTPTGPLGTTADILARGANIMPKLSLAKQYMGQAQGYSQGLEGYASGLGYTTEGQDSGLDLGPLGSTNDLSILGAHFRMPLINPTAISGILGEGGVADSYMTALKYPGLSGQETMQIQQSQAEKGWFPGTRQSQTMFDTTAHLYSQGGAVGELALDPGVQDMQEKALRSGVTSMDDFVETIKSIPDAAKNANESIGQMVADMNAYGDFNQQTGGTHFAGAQQALQMSSVTGLPAGSTQGLVESPWAQSAIFRATGMPSWMQGTLDGPTKNAAAMQGFFQLAHAVGRGKDYDRKLGAGYTDHVSAIETQAAQMHEFGLPNMKPETIAKLLRQGPGAFKKRNKVMGWASAWKENAESLIREGADPEKIDTYLSGGMEQGTNFGHLLKSMAAQKTATGARMFSQEDIRQIRSAGIGQHGEELARAKYNAVQEVLGTKAGKVSDAAGSPGQTVQIDLSPAARKFLQLPNKKSQMKLGVNAGDGQNVNSSYTGYTDPLTPPAGSLAVGNQMMSPNGSFYPAP